MKPRLWLALALLLPSIAVAAPIYRWVDANGQVHYGQTPPQGSDARLQGQSKPSGAKPSAPPAPAAASAPPVPNAQTAAASKKPAEPSAAETAKACAAARERIEMLQTKTARRIFLPQKDGSVSRMTDEEFATALAAAQKAEASNCRK